MSTGHEGQRLRKLYAGMGDGELLKLAGSRDELTEVAQQAFDAEVGKRGLEAPSHAGKFAANSKPAGGQTAEDPWLAPRAMAASAEMADRSEAESDPSLVELMTFQIAAEAEKALHVLEDEAIPVTMEPAMRRLTEDGPRIKTNWLSLFVERTRQEEARSALRKTMGLFPVRETDHAGHAHADAHEEDVLLPVGAFDVKADAETAQKALTEAGIWFSITADVDPAFSDRETEVTTIEVRAADLDRAIAAVETAFGEED